MTDPNGAQLPDFTAGAHIKVLVTLPQGEQDWRHYSLIRFLAPTNNRNLLTDYQIAIRLEENGRGGSRWMHTQLNVGDLVTIESPKNDFPLRLSPSGYTVLVAGGIGVTPLISMVAHCRSIGVRVRMFYAGRSRAQMAFLPELEQLLGPDLSTHFDDDAGSPLNIAALLDGCAPDDTIHVCGPAVMLDNVLHEAQLRHWAQERIHFELFTTPSAQVGDHAFEVVLSSSGRKINVGASQSILDALILAGCDPMFDCKRGECGVCATTVISGEIDHRDRVLTQREKDAGSVIQTCVSRCKGAQLVLDL